MRDNKKKEPIFLDNVFRQLRHDDVILSSHHRPEWSAWLRNCRRRDFRCSTPITGWFPSPISLFVELHDTQQSSKLARQRKVRFVNPADTQTNHYHHVEHNQGDL